MQRYHSLAILSIIVYSIYGLFSWSTAQGLPISLWMAIASAGIALGYALFCKAFGTGDSIVLKVDRITVGGGAFMTLAMAGLYLLYRTGTLAGTYPLWSVSALTFLAIDLVVLKKKLAYTDKVSLTFGVVLVAVGAFLIKSNGLAFQLSALPLIVFLAVVIGCGYYLMYYDMRRHDTSSKVTMFSIIAMVAAVLIWAAGGWALQSNASLTILAEMGIAGAAQGFALGAELNAVSISLRRSVRKDAMRRNFIQNLTNLDDVVVIALAILIGSFTYEQVAGGLVIVAGIYVLERLSDT